MPSVSAYGSASKKKTDCVLDISCLSPYRFYLLAFDMAILEDLLMFLVEELHSSPNFESLCLRSVSYPHKLLLKRGYCIHSALISSVPWRLSVKETHLVHVLKLLHFEFTLLDAGLLLGSKCR